MKTEWFSDIEEIVSDDFRFRAALEIGEDVYTLAKIKKFGFEAASVAGVATTGAQIAGSSVVASSLFTAPGFLGILGIGAAATPIGWIVAASILTGGAYLGISRYLNADNENITVVPRFINTPLDFLAFSLFGLMAKLSMKISSIDGHIADEEKETIRNFFIKTWGYSNEFTDKGLDFIAKDIDSFSVQDITTALAEFIRENPDCNEEKLVKAILNHLKEISEADGKLHKEEKLAIEGVKRVFETEIQNSILRYIKSIHLRFSVLKTSNNKRSMATV